MKQVKDGRKESMTNMSLILGSIFQSQGIPVHFTTVDCDDTVAAFAYHHGGSVLSRDYDFFRYFSSRTSRMPPYDVFFNYDIIDGRIILQPHVGPSRIRPRASPRELMTSLPETKESTFFLDEIPRFLKYSGEALMMYKRGCGSNLTQEMNPHLQV